MLTGFSCPVSFASLIRRPPFWLRIHQALAPPWLVPFALRIEPFTCARVVSLNGFRRAGILEVNNRISLAGISLGRAPLCSLRSCAPNSIGESICSFWMFCVGIGAAGPDDEDAVPPVLVPGTQWQAQWSVRLPLRLDLHSLSRHHRTRQASVCGPTPTQPLQPDVVPCLTTTLVVKYTCRCPSGPWSCCVTIVAFKFSALPFQGSPRTFFNSLITNLSSGGARCNGLAFWTPFSLRMMCSPVIGALPTQIPWPHLWSRLPVGTAVYLYITLPPNGNIWLVYVFFPKTRTNAILPSFFTWNLVRLHAACRISHAIRMLSLGSFSCRRFSSDNHIARQTPLITRFAFSNLAVTRWLALRPCFTSVRLTPLLSTAFNSCTNTGSWSECSITTLWPKSFPLDTHWMLSWDKVLLTSWSQHRLHWGKEWATFDPPLVWDPRSQTHCLARLHLFLVAAPQMRLVRRSPMHHWHQLR